MKHFFAGAVGIILTGLLAACSNQPTVHLYGKYLSQEARTLLVNELEHNQFKVVENTLDFPHSVEQSALLYSLIVQSPDAVTRISDLVNRQGYELYTVAPLEQGNHWYTKNSLALMLRPPGARGDTQVLTQDLPYEYRSVQCERTLRLLLTPHRSYTLLDPANAAAPLSQGSWHYRQAPYLEFRADDGIAFSYYSIKRTLETDIVSPISMLTLTPIQALAGAASCEFNYGERLLK